MESGAQHFLSFDLSTQSLKAIITDENLKLLKEESVVFDTELREFGTESGVHRHPDGLTVTSPTLMWVKALDILLMKMADSGVKFSQVSMISGTAQQHGSVYWAASAELTLQHLYHGASLADQLQNCFVVNDSPVWMDSSTRKQCDQLEAAVQGPQMLANITGSKAYERFTGAQIAKFYQENMKSYNSCERIALVSSFLASLFLGRFAAIDFSDGSGMNLLNINMRNWESRLVDACAPNLTVRLGAPVPSSQVLGNVSKYMVDRYNFSPQCSVVAFTGDNPASLVGMSLGESDIAVSLGTSDTLIFSTDVAVPSTEGHVFVNPVDQNKYMALLCFKNGSVARENVCNRCSGSSWSDFNDKLAKTPPGNSGNLGIYFDEMEILPYAKGVHRWNEASQSVSEFDDHVEVRAIIEGQLLAKRYHVVKFGFMLGPHTRILATGGASNNKSILQVMSDIFNCPIFTSTETSNSACLGGVYRCAHARLGDGIQNYMEIIKDVAPHQLACTPNMDNVELYETMLKRYIELETSVAQLYAPKVVAPVMVPNENSESSFDAKTTASVTTSAPNESTATVVATSSCSTLTESTDCVSKVNEPSDPQLCPSETALDVDNIGSTSMGTSVEENGFETTCTSATSPPMLVDSYPNVDSIMNTETAVDEITPVMSDEKVSCKTVVTSSTEQDHQVLDV